MLRFRLYNENSQEHVHYSLIVQKYLKTFITFAETTLIIINILIKQNCFCARYLKPFYTIPKLITLNFEDHHDFPTFSA